MGYSYSGVVDGLKEFFSSMRKLNVEIGTFEHTYNGIVSDAIFDTRDTTGWQLTFIKRIDGAVLRIPIQLGYRFSINGNEEYAAFRTYFEIGAVKGQFSIKDFVNHLNQQIPSEYRLNDYRRMSILRYDRLDNDSEGIYPIGVTNWEVAHAKNPGLPKDKYHRTSKNLDKTKELYPKIYMATKDMDITIIYGVNPGDKTADLKMGNYRMA